MRILAFVGLILGILFSPKLILASNNTWGQFSLPYYKEAIGSTNRLSVPNLETQIREKYFLDHQGEIEECRFAMSAASGLVASADNHYRRRGWNDVLGELLQVAKKFSSRSQYVGLRVNELYRTGTNHPPINRSPFLPLDLDDPSFIDKYVATIGLTYAKYQGGVREGLPLEEFLKTKVERPGLSKKPGLIFEIRTFSKDKIRAADAFPELFLSAAAMIFRKIQDYPELYDKNIIYTYADFEEIDGKKLPGVRLYQSMGFEVDESQGVFEFEGSRWRILRTSPKKLEALVFKFKGNRMLDGLNQAHPITLPSGIKSFAAPHHLIFIDDQEVVSGFTTTEELEVAPRIFAAPGATVRYEQGSRKLMGVTKLAKPVYSKSQHKMIPKGKGIYISSDGDPAEWIDPSIR